MAIWKEIRKALNSTLGTANFKPLDKLIEGYILRNKTFIPSENTTLMNWDNAFELMSSSAGEVKTIGTFKPYVSGFANLKIGAYTSNRFNAQAYIKIYEDGVLRHNTPNSSEDTSNVVSMNNIEFKADKTYKFDFVSQTIGSSSAHTHFNFLKINADVVDGFPHDYTIGGWCDWF